MNNSTFVFIYFLFDLVYSPGISAGMIVANPNLAYPNLVDCIQIIENVDYETRKYKSFYIDIRPDGSARFVGENFGSFDWFHKEILIQYLGKETKPIRVKDIVKRGIWIDRGVIVGN